MDAKQQPTGGGEVIQNLALQRANMKEALCEFALASGAKFDEVTLVEKEAHEGTKLRREYSIQKTAPMTIPSVSCLDDVLDSKDDYIEFLERIIGDALYTFLLTQKLNHYPKEHWANRAKSLTRFKNQGHPSPTQPPAPQAEVVDGCDKTPRDVAQYFLEAEKLYYRRDYDSYTLARFTSVIGTARLWGMKAALQPAQTKQSNHFLEVRKMVDQPDTRYQQAYEVLRDAMRYCRPEHVTRQALTRAEAIVKGEDQSATDYKRERREQTE